MGRFSDTIRALAARKTTPSRLPRARARQHAAGLDDFGRPLHAPPSYPEAASAPPAPTPALEAAVGDAVRANVRADAALAPAPAQEDVEEEGAHEASPLLPKRDAGRRKGLFRWLKR